MPKVEQRRRGDGTASYKVRFLNPHTRRESSRTFDVRKEAQAFARELEVIGPARALENLAHTDDLAAEKSLDLWAEEHIASLTKITDGTRLAYSRMYDRVWRKRLGSLKLSEITQTKVSLAINDYAKTITGRGKRRGPISDKTVANAHGLLAGITKHALDEGLIKRDPCAHTKLPDRTSHLSVEHRYLTHEEFGQLYDATHPHYQPLVLFLFGTGCRWGEAAAAQVGDFDPARSTIRIVRGEKYDPSLSRKQVGPPKTKESRRTIILPPEVTATLEALVDGRARDERLFLAPRGGPVVHRRFLGDIWNEAVKAAGLAEPKPAPHDARHSHVAWLIAAGVPLPVIQKRLGHKSITTTIDTYGHLLPDLQRAAAEAASLAFGMLQIEG